MANWWEQNCDFKLLEVGRGVFVLYSWWVTLQISQQFLKRKQNSRKGGVASRCMALCWVSVHGDLSSPCQAFGDFSTLICGSTSLWGLWVPRWGFCSGSPARLHGSPDTWRTPSSSCDTRELPPCVASRPCVSAHMHTLLHLLAWPRHFTQPSYFY